MQSSNKITLNNNTDNRIKEMCLLNEVRILILIEVTICDTPMKFHWRFVIKNSIKEMSKIRSE